MEFLLIGESKIKIVLTKEEAENYGLDGSSADVGGPGARRIFWRILDRARAEVGFDPCGDKVLIQLYPLKGGGGEIFVTKLGILSESSAKLVSKSDRIAMLSKKKSIYVFDSLDDIILASRAISSLLNGLSVQSDVYTDGNRYFLSIDEYGKGGEPVEFPCILEFGTVPTADILTYITEHATLLTEGDGVEKFAVL